MISPQIAETTLRARSNEKVDAACTGSTGAGDLAGAFIVASPWVASPFW
jgi:hypothetical protein